MKQITMWFCQNDGSWLVRETTRVDLAALWYLYDTAILPSRAQLAVLAEQLETTIAQLGMDA